MMLIVSNKRQWWEAMPIIFTAAFGMSAFSTEAKSAEWVGQGPTPYWSEAGNWSPAVPGPGDDVNLGWVPGTYAFAPLYDVASSTMANLTLGGIGKEATLSFAQNTSMTLTGDLSILGIRGPMLTIDKAGTSLAVQGNVMIGDQASGAELTLAGGAQFSQLLGRNTVLGTTEDGHGFVRIEDGSTSATFGNLTIGQTGKGDLIVSSGASVNAQQVVLGADPSAMGVIRASGANTTLGFHSLVIGQEGGGTFFSSDDSTLKVENDITIAAKAGSKGILYIGNPTNRVLPGKIDARQINFGSDGGQIILDHAAAPAARYTLDMAITGAGTLSNLSGTTLLTGDNSYSGPTLVAGGLLGIMGTGASDVTVRSGELFVGGSTSGRVALSSDGRLSGYGTVGSVDNAGTIQPERDGTTYGLKITGNYNGQGGSLIVNSFNGDDSSVKDALVIGGSASGTTLVTVNGLTGRNREAQHDIRIVEVKTPSAADAFQLRSDHFVGSEPAISAGAYSYVMRPNTDGWYLHNYTPDPAPGSPSRVHYNPGVPLYSSYLAAVGLFNNSMMGSLQERIGDRFTRWGAGPVKDNFTSQGEQIIWTKIQGGASHYRLDGATTNNKVDLTRWGLQGGIEFELSNTTAGQFHTSLWLTYGNQQTEIASEIGTGKLATHAYGVGGAATWFGENGFYVDGQAQYTLYTSDIYSRIYGEELASGKKAQGFNVGLEVGEQLTLAPALSVTPQMQLIYSGFNPADFNGLHASELLYDSYQSLVARAGLSFATIFSQSEASITDITFVANYYRELLAGKNKFNIGMTELDAGVTARNTVELGAGFNHQWTQRGDAIYGRVNIKIDPLDPQQAYQFSGNVGYKVRW